LTLLPRFATPGNLADPNPDAWSTIAGGLVADAAAEFPQFYDPTQTDTPDDAQVVRVVWPAFPASLPGSLSERLDIADNNRGAQDEYCEWAVERDGNRKISRVTFTSEVREYFEHLFKVDAATDATNLIDLYRQLVGPQVQPEDLEQDGSYLAENKWNLSASGQPVHLVSPPNTLGAAVQLAGQATILRKGADGKLVTHPQSLVECGNLGNPIRGSDPQVAATVNNAAASGAEITLHDPLGLYIDGLITGGMETPDGEDPGRFWTVERGDAEHALRAAYEVPAEEQRGYLVGDITIDGRPIVFGGQLAVRVRVRLDALVKAGNHQPTPQPCKKRI
jgi:hypothetical protein